MTSYFQDVQEYSATQTSIYFPPAPIAGVICNLGDGTSGAEGTGQLARDRWVAPRAMVSSTPKFDILVDMQARLGSPLF